MRGAGVTYEVALEPDPEILGEFEAWLEYHMDDMLALPGFTGASVHKAEDPETGAQLRVVRYELEDRAALERYFREFAPRMRALGLAKFGDRFRATRRIVLEGRDAKLTDARPCPNCNELLWGQYCASCGQRARARMITFWELLKDAGDLLASLDSRIWRTLGLLMFRPGRLTLDYLQGKRARFVPPMRLFIATTLVFFFIATLNAKFDFGPDGDPVIGAGDGWRDAVEQVTGDADPAADPAADPEATPESPDTTPAPPQPKIQVGTMNFDNACNVDYAGVPDWLARLLPAERAVEICERITLDRGRSFLRAVLANIPAMMFFFLPLMGLVMKLAYPLSGKYYAEHLLFLVHYHSFFFLLNIFVIGMRWGVEAASPGFGPLGAMTTAAYLYIPVYLFRAMQRVYGQGFLATSFKYALISFAYLFALIFTFLGVLLYTAVTL
jgi:hypothetical protein